MILISMNLVPFPLFQTYCKSVLSSLEKPFEEKLARSGGSACSSRECFVLRARTFAVSADERHATELIRDKRI